MGYRSWFTITSTWPEEYEAMALSTGIPIHDIVKRNVQQVSQYNFEDSYSISERTSILTSADEMKWYDWQEDMEKISRELPAVLFEVYMDGEESEDHRQLIAKDGNVAVSHGEVVYWQTEEAQKERQRILNIPDVISAKQFLING